eukprot:2412641-Pleurochrysis_carterae.AAC.2
MGCSLTDHASPAVDTYKSANTAGMQQHPDTYCREKGPNSDSACASEIVPATSAGKARAAAPPPRSIPRSVGSVNGQKAVHQHAVAALLPPPPPSPAEPRPRRQPPSAATAGGKCGARTQEREPRDEHREAAEESDGLDDEAREHEEARRDHPGKVDDRADCVRGAIGRGVKA